MKKIFLALAFLTTFVPAASTQDPEEIWQELENQVAEPLERKDPVAAEQKAKEVLATAEKTFGPTHTYTGKALYMLAIIYQETGKKKEAAAIMKRLQEIMDRNIQKRQMIFGMSWQYGEPDKEWPEAKHIVLTFVDYPNHYMGIYSKDLGPYLESLKKDHVPVVLRISYDTSLQKVMSHSLVQIGDLKKWQDFRSYTGTKGDYSPAPYDEIKKLVK
jgi:hypothetical protein